MNRERVLKVVVLLVGLLFLAGIYPVAASLWHADQSMYTDDMMLSLYVTLGVFLLLAARNPSAHRSLIAFTAWSSLAHATVMSVQAYLNFIARRELIGSAVFMLIGVALIALAPASKPVERASTVAA